MAATIPTSDTPLVPVPCPICGEHDCSLYHYRDRLVIPIYNNVVVPVVNVGAKVLGRVGIAVGIVIFVGVLAGWWR